MADQPLILDVVINDQGAIQTLRALDRAETELLKTGQQVAAGLGAFDTALVKSRASLTATERATTATTKPLIVLTDAWKHDAAATTAATKATDTATTSLLTLKQSATTTAAQVSTLQRSASTTAGPMRALGGTVSTLTSALGLGTLGVAGLAYSFTEMIKGAVSGAGRIADLAAKTDLSIETVQKFGFIAEQTGSSVEQMASSAFKLSVNLSRGGTQVRNAVEGLGLSVQTLRTLNPEQQFDAVARALAGITDTQERNRIGVQLFGRAYEQIAPAIREYPQLIDKASAASAANVKALDALGDKASAFWESLKARVIDTTGAMARFFLVGGPAPAERGKVAPLGPQQPVGFAMPDWASNLKTQPMTDYVQALAEARAELAKLSPATIEQIKAVQALGMTTEELAKQFKISDDAIAVLGTYLADLKKQQDDATAATERAKKEQAAYNVELGRMAQQLIKINAIPAGAFDKRRLPGQTGALDLSQGAFGNVMPQELQRLPGVTGDATQAIQMFFDSVKVATPQTRDFDAALGRLVGSFQTLSQVSGGGLGSFTRNTGTALASVGTLRTSFDEIGKASWKSGGGIMGLGKNLLSFAGPVASAISGAVSLGKALGGLLGIHGRGGRNMVVDFAATQGGFDALHAALAKAGAAGEAAWAQLSGVGGKNAGNKDMAQAAIQAVQAALHGAAAAADELRQKTEDANRALRDIIDESNFDADQAGRTGIEAVIAELNHRKEQEIAALAQYAAGDAALYQQAVEAVTRKYTALADKAIAEESKNAAAEMAQQAQAQVDDLAKVSTLLQTIKGHTDTEIASLGQFSSAGAFYNAVIGKIRGRQQDAELSALKRAGENVVPGGGDTRLAALTVNVDQLLVTAGEDDPDLARRIGQQFIDELRQKGQRF